MQYDVFICHASEDKQSFVQPLAEALRKENVSVWYDDFVLRLGDSIRRAIDRGLTQSRFGVIVLSAAFFHKKWPQYELDALAHREMRGNDKIVLPVWHNITESEIIAYSPALADRKAVSSLQGISAVVDEILAVVHPQQSPLIVARDLLLEWGVTPPVITDEYWLDVVEASNRLPAFGAAIPEQSSWNRWSFPLPERDEGPRKWGERLAWTAMQMKWVKTAEEVPITPLTPPQVVLDFINGHSGLLETCMTFPGLTAEYAPQLTIRGFGGPLEHIFEQCYLESCAPAKNALSPQGSIVTTNKPLPACDDEWALRHPTFGDYDPSHIAYEYFHGGMFGPDVSPYEEADHAFWLLSSNSTWLPENIHSVLLKGIKSLHWVWYGVQLDGTDKEWESCGQLWEELQDAVEKRRQFKWTERAKDDALNRISWAAKTLGLSDTPSGIFARFVEHGFANHYVVRQRDVRTRRTQLSARKKT